MIMLDHLKENGKSESPRSKHRTPIKLFNSDTFDNKDSESAICYRVRDHCLEKHLEVKLFRVFICHFVTYGDIADITALNAICKSKGP